MALWYTKRYVGFHKMYKFSHDSISKLETCDPRLQKICKRAIEIYDFTVLEGFRDAGRQKELYDAGKSRVKSGDSKHNLMPSKAVDLVPYPIDWENTKRFYYLAGIMFTVADWYGIKIRWGGDFNMDNDFDDGTFNDLVHFELI